MKNKRKNKNFKGDLNKMMLKENGGLGREVEEEEGSGRQVRINGSEHRLDRCARRYGGGEGGGKGGFRREEEG